MVKQTAVAGPISRAIGVRLHTEMGEAGEDVWGKIVQGEVRGHKPDALWNNKPSPVDVIDWRNRIGEPSDVDRIRSRAQYYEVMEHVARRPVRVRSHRRRA